MFLEWKNKVKAKKKNLHLKPKKVSQLVLPKMFISLTVLLEQWMIQTEGVI